MAEIKSDKAATEIISHTKSLLCITDTEQDARLEALLEQAYSFASAYSSSPIIPSTVLSRMICEDYSKPNGVSSRSVGGIREDYQGGYSSIVISTLNSLKRLRSV